MFLLLFLLEKENSETFRFFFVSNPIAFHLPIQVQRRKNCLRHLIYIYTHNPAYVRKAERIVARRRSDAKREGKTLDAKRLTAK